MGIRWILDRPLTWSHGMQLPTFIMSIILHQCLVQIPQRVEEFILFVDVAMIALTVLSNGVFCLETDHQTDYTIAIYATLAAFFMRFAWDAYLVLTRREYIFTFLTKTRWLYLVATNVVSVAFWIWTHRVFNIAFWSLPIGYIIGFAFYMLKPRFCLNFHEILHIAVLFVFYLRCFVLPAYI